MSEISIDHLGTSYTILFDEEDREVVTKYKWHFYGKSKYAYYGCREKGKIQSMFLHRLIMKARKNEWVDHINGNVFDNRKCNLRIATPLQSSGNRRKAKLWNASSKYKGVCRDGNRWIVRVGKTFRKSYPSELEAAHAYDKAARDYFGEFAYLNFPEELP